MERYSTARPALTHGRWDPKETKPLTPQVEGSDEVPAESHGETWFEG